MPSASDGTQDLGGPDLYADTTLDLDLAVSFVPGNGATTWGDVFPPDTTYACITGLVDNNGDGVGDEPLDGDLEFGRTPLCQELDVVESDPDVQIKKYILVVDTFDGLLCETFGKPKELMLRYTGENNINHSQDPSKVEVINYVSNLMDFDWVCIIASDKGNPDDSKAKVFFQGEVGIGDSFVVDSAGLARELKANTYIHVFDHDGNKLQRVKFHTTCSQPLNLGDEFSSVEQVGFFGENGAGIGVLP